MLYHYHSLQEDHLFFAIQEYQAVYGGKNWNFPKAHAVAHMFDDIESKGVTQNFNSKFNEKLHGLIKEIWELTNRKDIEPQVEFINIFRIHVHANTHDIACKYLSAGPYMPLDQRNDGPP